MNKTLCSSHQQSPPTVSVQSPPFTVVLPPSCRRAPLSRPSAPLVPSPSLNPGEGLNLVLLSATPLQASPLVSQTPKSVPASPTVPSFHRHRHRHRRRRRHRHRHRRAPLSYTLFPPLPSPVPPPGEGLNLLNLLALSVCASPPPPNPCCKTYETLELWSSGETHTHPPADSNT